MDYRAALMLALCASQADAGAWPRAEGSAFVSLSHRMGINMIDPFGTPPTQYTALFFEYGMTDRLTLGIDAGRSVSGASKIVLFAGWPVLRSESGHVIGVELGIGQIEGDTVLRPALSYGYGFQRRGLSSWVAVDTVAEILPDTSDADIKLDLTYGLGWPSGIKAYTQIQAGKPHDEDAFARLAGAVVIPNRLGISTEFAVEYGLFGDDSLQFKLGVWREF